MKRRDALRGFGIGAVAAGSGGVGLASEADAQEVRARVNTRSEPSQLKITDLRVVRRCAATGSSASTRTRACTATARCATVRSPTYALMLKSRILGENPCHVDKVFRKIKQFGFHGRQAGGAVAIEMACWDLAGKAWGVPCWQMLGGKFRDRIRVYADTPGGRRPGGDGASGSKARIERGFTFLKMDVSINLLEGRRRRAQRTRRARASTRSTSTRAATFAQLPHPFTGIRITDKGLKVLQEYVRDRARDRRLGHPDRDRPLRPLRHRGRHQARAGARPVQPRLARGHGAVAVHRPVRAPEELLQDPDPHRARTSTSRKASATCSRRRRSPSATRTSPPPAACSRRRRSATSRWSTGSHGDAHGRARRCTLFASVHCAAATENFLVMEHHNVDDAWYDDLVDRRARSR